MLNLSFSNKGEAYEEFLLTAFASYLSRLSGIDRFDLGFSCVELQKELSGLEGLFADRVPLRLEIETQQSFEKNLAAVSKQVKFLKKHQSYPRDLGIRIPQLRSQLLSEGERIYPVVVKIVDSFTDYIDAGLGSELTLIISRQTQECCWLYNACVLGHL
jgi:hypothetical protein